MTTTQHVDKKYGLHKFFANEVLGTKSDFSCDRIIGVGRNLKKRHGYIPTSKVTWTYFLHD